MSKYGLIGFPIAHSLSPRLFEAAYGGRFRYDLLEFEDFEQAFRVFMKSYDAVNVTAPFKELAFAKAKFRSTESELTGAANILVKTSRGLSCFNSDCTSVRAILEDRLGKSPEDGRLRKVLVVGCGGAGKAAAAAAYTLGLDVTVMNRNMSRALDFVHHVSTIRPSLARESGAVRTKLNFGTVSVLPLDRFGEEFFRHDVLIYTLPAPLEIFPFMASSLGNPLPAEKRESPAGSRLRILIEANYRSPSFTPEVRAVLPPRLEYVPGEQWLLGQAITGYGLMTGVNPDLQKNNKFYGISQ